MAVYSTRAEWLEAQTVDHFHKLASLTVKTTDVYFMGKFAAHAFTPDLEKDAGIGGGVTMFAQNLARKFSHLAGKAGAGAGGGTASLLSKLRGSAGSVATGGARAGTVATRAAAPVRAATSARTAATGMAVPSRTAATGVAIPAGAPAGGDTLLSRWQSTLLQSKAPPPTAVQRAPVKPTLALPGNENYGVAPTLMSGGGAPRAGAGAVAPARTTPIIERNTGPLPAPRFPASQATEAGQLAQMRAAGIPEERLQQIQAAFGGRAFGSSSTPVTSRMLQGRGQTSVTSTLQGYGQGPGGQMIPLYQPRVHVSSHKFNTLLLDIMERSMPNDMIKSAALYATLDDEGILKVASEDSYWYSARGVCHLNFLAGVYDVDPDMAWTFAKNAGIIGGIGKLFGMGARGAGQAAGAVSRGAGAAARGVQAGAGAVRGAAQAGAGAVRGAAQRGAGAVQRAGSWWSGAGTATPGLNPFRRGAQNVGQKVQGWWRGTGSGTQMSLPGMEGPATNPFQRAGRAVAEKARGAWQGAKQQFSEGFQAGRTPAPKQMDLQFGKAEPVGRVAPAGGGRAATKAAPEAAGKGPYRKAPAPEAAPAQGDFGFGTPGPAPAAAATSAAAAPAAAAAAPAGKVAPAQPGFLRQQAEKTLGTLRMMGTAGAIGVPVVAGLGIHAAGKLLERNPAPYQYGMGAPATWNFPQQM